MALYLSGNKYKCKLGSSSRIIMVDFIKSEKPELNGDFAITFDGYYLKTADDFYLIFKKEE